MFSLRFNHLVSSLSLTLLLASCASTDSTVGGTWKQIGTTNNGNIVASIDKSSIQKNGAIVTFRDKKTIIKPSEERFVNTPSYKTAIGEWEIHCTNRTYRLKALKLLDGNGKELFNQTYQSSIIRPMSVMTNTITEKQYHAICKQ